MLPDFSQKTIDILAKRAGYLCSNPDCRISTVGPNSNPKKATIIGEAAHIQGARSKSKRYNSEMTENARANITNGIWLCRNCHKLIDSDEEKFSSNILFTWREEHECYVQSELGNTTERIRYEQQSLELKAFENYPHLIRRIIIDKPEAWEYRLTAELMRYLNDPLFRKIQDLQRGLYVIPQEDIGQDEISDWIHKRLNESTKIIPPMVGLIDGLNESWGPPGIAGSVDEIRHICHLIRDNLEQIIKYEEKVYFTTVPEKYEKIVGLLKNLLASQAEKLKIIPNKLDEIVGYLDNSDDKALKELDGKKETIYLCSLTRFRTSLNS